MFTCDFRLMQFCSLPTLDAGDFKHPNTTSLLGLREERQQIYNASQSNWIQQTVNGGSVLCYCGRGHEKQERREREREGERIFLEFCVQFDMSLMLGVRRWPYVRMFHIGFFLVISVQNTARRNTGQLQAKVIQRSYPAWCIQKTHVDTDRGQTTIQSVCVV